MLSQARLAALYLLGLALFVAPARAAGSSQDTSENALKSSIGKPAPEFGPSVVFDRSDGTLQLSDLRGKMVVVVFFQSWCPICNTWSPDFLQQMAKAFGDDPSVALVAIKVDGGTPTEAKAYLKEHKANLSQWIVASDTGGTYYQRVNGTNSLWGYAVIDNQGRLIDRGHAGGAYDEPAGKRYALADPGIKKKAIKPEPAITIDSDTPAELLPIAKAAQAGKLVLAIRALKTYDHGKLKKPALKLKTSLEDALLARADKASADVKSDDPEIRYRAYQTLGALSALSDLAAGKSAQKTLASLRADKTQMADITRQADAEKAFWSMITKSIRLDLQLRKAQLPIAMKQFAEFFSGTAYADRAMHEADTIAGGVLLE